MAKQIKFTSAFNETEISIQFNKAEEGEKSEVMIETNSDAPWYSFTDPNELKDFIDELKKLHQQLVEEFGIDAGRIC